ncbi:ABC transporter permease [Streptomyces graminilatus]|uniref:ABC transporter permease n=1 Tax=Streptomyces graminilatus TaxID=1464070 RepID=UPI0006E1652D|nr:ABC transporter permease [Streptomyces graminilatus]
MSTVVGAGEAGRTTPAGRMRALARAEWTLFLRNKGTLFAALFVPLVLPFTARSAADGMDLKEAGLNLGTVILPSSIGFSLLFAVYMALVLAFVARREELVLKRLRTGEPRDAEILAGTSLPAVTTGLVQSLVLIIGCSVAFDLDAPPAPQLAVIGLLLGVVMCAALAALTASFSATTESAQVTSIPLMLISFAGSGLAVPLEVLPDRVALVCEFLPLTPAITLVRGAWTGNLSAYEALGAVLAGLAWTVLSVFAVRRWFRWEPRR